MTDQSLQPLTSAQMALLRQTFRSMDTDRLAMTFYSSLFTQRPEVRPLFPPDLTVLSTKIVSVLELVAYSFTEISPGKFVLQPDVIRPLRTLGQLHDKKGVIDKYYPWANELLIKSMRAESSVNFTPDIELAWKLALNHLTVAMLSDIPVADSEHQTMRESYHHIRSLLFKV